MKARIFLKEFQIQAHIGVHAFEIGKSQPIKVSVLLDLETIDQMNESDSMNNVVDYDFIRNTIKDLVESGHINTQEWLVHRLIEKFLGHPAVLRATVSSEKTAVYPEPCSVGYEASQEKLVPAGV